MFDWPRIFALSPNGIEVQTLEKFGSFNEEFAQQITDLAPTHLLRLTKGLLVAASESSIHLIVKSTQFHCYNCGMENDHFSRACKTIEQQYTRCPECNVVASSPSGHKIACKNGKFVSERIGDYELPFKQKQNIRFTFKNVPQIYCAEATMKGIQNFLITKFSSLGVNIQMRRVYGANELILDVKLKPAVTIGIGRMNSKTMASLMLCDDHVRVNHYYHIDANGNVSFNLATISKTDQNHDVELKLISKQRVIFFSLQWNEKWKANLAMSDTAVTIR